MVNSLHAMTIGPTNEWDPLWFIFDEATKVCIDCCNQ
jgi:hypothetical protein